MVIVTIIVTGLWHGHSYSNGFESCHGRGHDRSHCHDRGHVGIIDKVMAVAELRTKPNVLTRDRFH